MTYRLRIDPTIHGDYLKLPDDARRDLGLLLLDAMGDPIARSEPYGIIDDGRWRSVGRGYVTGVFTIDEETRTILLISFTYAG